LFLQDKGVKCSYSGVDINPNMILEAEIKYPGCKFSVGSVLNSEYSIDSFDYVLASGMLTILPSEGEKFIQSTLTEMVCLARLGVGVNFLSSNAPLENKGEHYIDPGSMLNFCLTLSSQVVVRHDYLSHDVTYFIYPEKPAMVKC